MWIDTRINVCGFLVGKYGRLAATLRRPQVFAMRGMREMHGGCSWSRFDAKSAASHSKSGGNHGEKRVRTDLRILTLLVDQSLEPEPPTAARFAAVASRSTRVPEASITTS